MKTIAKSAAVYSTLTLKLYDWWVLDISNTFFWKCSTKHILQPFFCKNLSHKHLDIGVGTGFYLGQSHLDSSYEIALMDLNEDCLNAAKKRIAPIHATTIQHNVFEPLSSEETHKFSSISLFYLLHCLSGLMSEKGVIFQNLKNMLTPEGVIYGATVLGSAAQHNFGGKKLIKLYNLKGIFGNLDDTAEDLKCELEKHFHYVSVKVHGKVALFEAKHPY